MTDIYVSVHTNVTMGYAQNTDTSVHHQSPATVRGFRVGPTTWR